MRLALLFLLVPTLAHAQLLSGAARLSPTASATFAIVAASLPQGTEDVEYVTVCLSTVNASGSVTWTVDSGALPAGLTLGESTGCISGTPTADDGETANFVIEATDGAMAADTEAFSIVILEAAEQGLPEDWASVDIGTGQAAGSCSEDGMGVFTEAGAGNTYGTSDQFHFCYQAVTGGQELIAELTDLTATSTKRGGIMIRTALTADAPYVFIGQGTTGTPLMQWRLTAGASTSDTGTTGTPGHFRLTQLSGHVSAFYGADGLAWTQLGSALALPISGTYYIGLAVFTSTAQAQSLATGTFDNVAIAAFTGDEEEVDFGNYRPHYQGFGTNTLGGHGDTTKIVCAVNSLLDTSGAPTSVGTNHYRGTFRQCVEGINSSYVVFETSGNIVLTSRIVITNPYLTIAGQTAPSPGILLERWGMRINTHDVVMQHVRFRMGDASNTNQQCVWVGREGGAFNVVFDHVSFAYCLDDALVAQRVSGTEPQDIAVLDSLFGPMPQDLGGLYSSSQCHGGSATGNGTAIYMRNLWAHCDFRTPELQGGWRAAIISNLRYNYALNSPSHRGGARFQCTSSGPWAIEGVAINNVSVEGPDTAASQKTIRIQDNDANCPDSEYYLEGNTAETIAGASAGGFTGTAGDGQWAGVHADGTTQASVRIDARPVWYTAFNFRELAADDVEACVIANAGARPSDRDTVDSTVISNLQSRNGEIPNLDAGDTVPAIQTLSVNTQTYTIPSDPHDDDDEDGRPNIQDDLETKAQALESWAACGF